MMNIAATGVSSGMGAGKAYILKKKTFHVPTDTVNDIDKEMALFDWALNVVVNETKHLLEKVIEENRGSNADILDAYIMLMDDPATSETVRRLICQRHNAANAVLLGMDEIIKMFENMDDDYMRERVYDIRDIQNRLLAVLLGHQSGSSVPVLPGAILIAKDLSPSDTAKIELMNVNGIVTVEGGINSHTSIIARSLEIPAVVGAEYILDIVQAEDTVLVNGIAGNVTISPSIEIYEDFNRKKEKFDIQRDRMKIFIKRPSVSKDGHKIKINANIGAACEIQRAVDRGADGIGLYRSESLFISSMGSVPNETVQFNAYRTAATCMGDKPVTIRTMDLGADKDFLPLADQDEDNPSLGYRAIRIHLDRQDMFKVQLRAILRASNYGNVRLMFPLISCLDELREAKNVLEQVKNELRGENIAFDENIKVGTMIEVPSAAILSDHLARECDFFSIGTNDLIQYTSAVDRNNKKVAYLYSHYNPAVLRLISTVIDSAHRHGIPCGMCGEMASDLLILPVLLGMGLDEFSNAASQLLRTRIHVAKLDYRETAELAKEVLDCPTESSVMDRLKAFAEKIDQDF